VSRCPQSQHENPDDAKLCLECGRRTDKREQAREHLTTATTMYREVDMRYWWEQADAELTGKE
jgi:uncharacterized membrane protein YvbJ